MVGDVLRLEDYRLDVDTVIDAGCLHAMTDGEREAYVRSVGRVLRVGGMFHVLCFSEHDAQEDGPRRVRREELEGAFSGPDWEIEELVEARFETNIHKAGARAYRVSVWRRG
jgi:cyclopropane fatty-acyl-phospholipid synthase-like methyltransferase